GAAHGEIDVEHDGKVVDHRVLLGERHVVQHRAARGLDVDELAHVGVAVDDRVLHLVAPTPVVRHRVQLARHRVELGVGGVPTGQCAVEVATTDGLELVVELVRTAAGLDDGKRATG